MLDLYLVEEISRDVFDGKRCLLERKIKALEEEFASVQDDSKVELLTEEQLTTIEAFGERISRGIDLAREDQQLQREIVELLDIFLTLAGEENEKVMHVRYPVGADDLSIRSNPSGGAGGHRRPFQRG